MGEKITNDEAQEILEEIEDNIDSKMGVSWTSQRVGIEDLIKKWLMLLRLIINLFLDLIKRLS